MSINWNNIRPLENSQNEGFEELVCQLARKESIPNKTKFIRKGKPDAGVECFWILSNNDEWAWQAKYFTASLTSTQWNELDHSVQTVLDKHSNLTKYIIAIPNDPSDARLKGQKSMLDKWNDRVSKWEGWASTKGLTVEFLPWWSSDLIDKLSKQENEGLKYFWFNKEEFTTEWCKEQTEMSILDLGTRYTPNFNPALNVELKISKIFNGLSRNKEFVLEITELFDELLTTGKKVIPDPSIKQIKHHAANFQNLLKDLHSLFLNTDFQGVDLIPVSTFLALLEKIKQTKSDILLFYIEEESKTQNKESSNYGYYTKHGREASSINRFDKAFRTFVSFLEGISVNLANNPFLLLDGEAGIGKSHLLADVVKTRDNQDLVSLFFLGQHFVTEEDPWTQIFSKNQIRCSVDEFLGALNSKAQVSGSRCLLFIDAVNEGKGKLFWNSNINSFLSKIKKHEWLGIVFSVRTSYKKLLFPKEKITSNNLVIYTHYGFSNQEYEASKLFFNFYNIELPSVPFLNPEFQNPLFLLLFCEGLKKAGHNRIPDGFQGISSIIEFFINSINKTLSSPTRLNYPIHINIVQKAINKLITYKIENQQRYISYETAYLITTNLSKEYSIRQGLLEELISEGILSKNLFWKDDDKYEEGIYLAYERFEDHLTANVLIENLIESSKVWYASFVKLFSKNYFFNKAIKPNGILHKYIKDENTCWINTGLIEALAVQLPEKLNIEIYEIVSQSVKNSVPIIESFIKSLLWRKTETTSKKLTSYVNSTIAQDYESDELFLNTIISITAIPDHYFNAEMLHKHLNKYNLGDRDSWWNHFLKENYYNSSAVKRLVDWAWDTKDKKHISDESILLSSTTLAWFLTSTNRELRDSSTKVLISLLENRIHLLVLLLKKFADTNDTYIYERLFAVAYGCAIRTTQRDKLVELCQYIFNVVFDKDQIYPHILLRDYARGVIEYAAYLNLKLEFDISKARPPYSSLWSNDIPTESELKLKYDKKEYFHLWESIMGFGDFARYIIGTNSHSTDWSSYKRDEKPIDRDAIFINFKSKLSINQTDLLENLTPYNENSDDLPPDFSNLSDEELEELIATLGANYIKGDEEPIDEPFDFSFSTNRKNEQELKLAKEAFKKSLSSQLLKEYETEIEPFLDSDNNIAKSNSYFNLKIAQRYIFDKVIKLGWQPKLHLEFDKLIGTGRARNTQPHERIGKKYQWIAYHEFMARLSDNFAKYEEWSFSNKKFTEYEGPWAPFIRDIDPTILIKNTGKNQKENSLNHWWLKNGYTDWELENKKWLEKFDDLPNPIKLINPLDENNEEWLILEGHPSWSEEKKIGEEKWNQPRKNIWYQIRSYLVSVDEFETLKKWALKQDFMGRWMPEYSDRYEVFSREYYWSPAYEYFNKEYYNGIVNRNIHDQDTGKLIGSVMLTAESFLWETSNDKSKEDSFRFLKPAKHIYEKMNMQFAEEEGSFIDKKSHLVCFDPSVNFDSTSYLLIKKKPFVKYLKENNLKVIWTVLGQKNILGGHSNRANHRGQLNISGAYYLTNNNDIKGKLTPRKP